jgi:Zn-dependent protease/predicted transcriptional regulator
MNGREWQIARILGIPIKIHTSWFLVFAFLTWSLATGYFPETLPGLSPLRYWGMGGVAALLLFASVLLHELGHSYVALRYRIPIKQITLFFFGGMAQMRQEPPGPRAEFWIAIAGPVVSFLLAGTIFGFMVASSSTKELQGLFVLAGMLGSINLTLGLFNLIPGFPLDGGRVLRAGLWAWSGDFYRATRQASIAGQGFGVAFGLLGAFLIVGALTGMIPSPIAANGGWILLVGLFLFFVARASRQQAVIRDSLSRVEVRQVMVQHVVTLDPQLSVDQAVNQYFLPHGYNAFPVVKDGQLVGMVTVLELQGISQPLWAWRRVQDIMEPTSDDMVVEPNTPLLRAFERMMQGGRSHLVVVKHGQLVGLLTSSAITRFLQLRGRIGTASPLAS